MKIITIELTSEMVALQHVAKVRNCTHRPKVKFGTGSWSTEVEVCFKKSYRTKGMELDSVSLGFNTSHIFFARNMEELSEEKLMYVGAAMMALGIQSMAWDDYLVTLQERAVVHTVVVERQVERHVIIDRPNTTVTRRTTITECDPHVSVGAVLGAGLGALIGILNNRR